MEGYMETLRNASLVGLEKLIVLLALKFKFRLRRGHMGARDRLFVDSK